MATYTMRFDGTAANRAAAVNGDPAVQAECMNEATFYFSGNPLADGDIVLMSSQGGEYTSRVRCPSTAGTTYLTNYPGESPVINSATLYGIQTLGTSWNLSNITITGAPEGGLSADGATVVADNLTITGVAKLGVRLLNTASATITNCTITDSGTDGVFNDGSNGLTITDTTIIGSGGIGITSQENATILRVTVKNGGSTGIFIYGGATATVTDSEISDNDEDGVSFNGTSASTAKRNKICNNGSTASASSGDGITSHDTATFTASNNEIYGNFKSGVAGTGGSSGNVYNNTIYNNYEATNNVIWSTAKGMGIGVNATGTWNIKNNICSNNEAEILFTAVAVAAATIASDYNILNNSRGGLLAYQWNDVDFAALGDYQTASSQDAASVNSDPQFRNAALNILSVRRESPAIDGGVAVSGQDDRLHPSSNWTDDVSFMLDPIMIGAYGFVDYGATTAIPDKTSDQLVIPNRS